MEFENIIKLIEAVSESSLTKFEMEEGEFKISMKTDKEAKGVPVVMEACTSPVMQPQAAPAAMVQAAPVQESTPAASKPSGNIVKAPLVGTFYAAGSPDAEPFVKVGDKVTKGQTLGIVEAMKLMNEIESEFDGIVSEILIENEDVVEYGQPMFVIQ